VSTSHVLSLKQLVYDEVLSEVILSSVKGAVLQLGGVMRPFKILKHSVHLGSSASGRHLLSYSCNVRPSQPLQKRLGRRSEVLLAAQELLPTIPRQKGVSEGAWDLADVRAVREALVDSQASTSGRTSEGWWWPIIIQIDISQQLKQGANATHPAKQ
jgi:hypothetical protein